MTTPAVRILGWIGLGATLMLGVEEALRHDHLRLLLSLKHQPSLADEGETDFSGVAEVSAGLGPAFNARSCVSCHYLPSVGGAGAQTVLRLEASGVTVDDPAAERSLFAATSIADHECQPRSPAGAPGFQRRIPTPLFGAGQVEAIPDEAIAALADPDDLDEDGVRGRVASIRDAATDALRVGRFGWKAQDATVVSAVARAYAHEMGVTNRLFPHELSVGISADRLAECDTVKDPEDVPDAAGRTAVDRITAFLRQLPPPEPRAPGAQGQEGERIFAVIGCATCHRPSVGAARAYSDFLLHDVGTGDGIAQGDATGQEMRTAPLWGVGTRRPFLHDGRAPTLEAAINAHAGEAADSQRRFTTLSDADRYAILDFLRSL
jgi:CxxC motif-containing protein (DUF1111 family)